MAGCEVFATKTEVAQLRETVVVLAGQLAAKLDKAERQPIVEDSINGANARYGLAMVPVALPALTQLIPYIAGLIALISSFFGLQNLINGLQSLIGFHESEISRILGRLTFIEQKNSEQDELLNYFKNYAIPILKADISVLNRELEKANREISKANQEIGRLNGELAKANAAINAANTEIKRVAGIANQAASDANKAIAETQAINQKLDREYKVAIQLAISKADFAIQTINNLGNDLIEELQIQSGRMSSLESQNARLAAIANSARTDANRAIEIANNALSASQQAQSTSNSAASTANNVTQEIRNGVQIRYFEPTITNAIVRINQQVTNTSIQQASNEIQQRLSQGNQQINQQFAAAAQASTQIRNISIAEASAEIQRQLTSASNEIQRTLSEAGARVRATVEPLVIERAIAASPTIQDLKTRTTAPTVQPALQAEVASLKGRITEQERMNERGLTEIGVIAGAIAALPNTFAQNPNYRAAMTDVAAAGTCQTTRPGGCMANQFQNLQNGQADLLNKLGLGLQAGQGAILTAINNTVNRIDLKMGAQITGGLSGGLNRVSNFLGIDRLMNLVTTIVVLHNAAMLSSALKDTLLSMVSSVGKATGLLVDAEGNAVDTNALFNQGVETFLKGLLGDEVYANTKLTFNRANRFYQASANIVNSIQGAINGVQAIVERGAEYTGKIGNALKRFGMVGENAYSWMSENMNTKTAWLDRLQARVSQTSELISGVDDIAQNVISVQDSVKQLAIEKQEFDKALKNLTPTKPADNSVVAAQVKLDKDASQAPTTTFADIP